MNAADLARLEVAKRAYKASEPSTAEVQSAVRRARLALRRPRPRRVLLGKALVMVVLAMGGLAFAKPHALSELLGNALDPLSAKPPKRPAVAAGVAAPPEPRPQQGAAVAPAFLAPAAATPETAAAAAAPATPHAKAPAVLGGKAAPARLAGAQAVEPERVVAASPSSASATPSEASGTVSEWGRVGQALARGDETRALVVLGELSESNDPRTRNKADLGRAQLFMANGNRDQACATARSLTNRRAGSHIERQAQLLLKSCTR